MQQASGESEEDQAMRCGTAKQALQQVTQLINEADEVRLGWNVDGKANTTYVEFEPPPGPTRSWPSSLRT